MGPLPNSRQRVLLSTGNIFLYSLMSKERFKIVPASYLVLILEGRVLLSRRFQTGYEDGKYSLVAGHLDGGETFREAMVREAKEETAIDVLPEDMRVVHMMHRYCSADNDPLVRERIDAFVTAERWGGIPKIMEPEKCDDLRWCPLEDLPENTIPYVRVALEHIRDGVTYSEFGFHDDVC